MSPKFKDDRDWNRLGNDEVTLVTLVLDQAVRIAF